MFLGSFHDLIARQNVGVCMPFGIEPHTSGAADGEQQLDSGGIYYQRKRHASKKLGEVLVPVEVLDFPIYVTDMGRIAVLICSDIYDVSLFLGLVRYNLRCLPGGEIDYVFVPSFNRSRKLVDTCRQLSFLMNNVVMYVSSYQTENSMSGAYTKKCHWFVCGKEGNELEEEKRLLGEIIAEDIVPEEERQKSEHTTLTIYPERVSTLRMLTRKEFSEAIHESGQRLHVIE